jgi:putative PIN family toxin of toxin-antitoxin system
MTLAVYDTMVFFQWATLPPAQPHRQHATVTALVNRSVRLCLSPELIFEVRNVLLRPELQAKYKTLTPEHVAGILSQAMRFADWFENVPRHFTLPSHPKDDHILNLAIESKAEYLVTWETRILKLASDTTAHADQLRTLAPQLRIITPKELAARLPLVQ